MGFLPQYPEKSVRPDSRDQLAYFLAWSIVDSGTGLLSEGNKNTSILLLIEAEATSRGLALL